MAVAMHASTTPSPGSGTVRAHPGGELTLLKNLASNIAEMAGGTPKSTSLARIGASDSPAAGRVRHRLRRLGHTVAA